MLTYGENLRRIREAIPMKTGEFASVLGIQYRTYLSYERGERAIPNELIEQIVNDYKVNANFLFTGEGDIFNVNSIKPCHIAERTLDVDCMKLDFGERIYLIQKYNGKSDGEMAEIIDMSLSRYYEITNDSKEITLGEYDKIKAHFDVSIDDIRYDEKKLFKNLEQEMNKDKNAYEALSPEEKEAFKKFLKKQI